MAERVFLRRIIPNTLVESKNLWINIDIRCLNIMIYN